MLDIVRTFYPVRDAISDRPLAVEAMKTVVAAARRRCATRRAGRVRFGWAGELEDERGRHSRLLLVDVTVLRR